MAGLQQYNFFPTDLFYPRPQPSVNLDSKAVVIPLKTPTVEINNVEDIQIQNQQKLPKSSALVYNQKSSSVIQVEKEKSEFYKKSLSWLRWYEDEESSESF